MRLSNSPPIVRMLADGVVLSGECNPCRAFDLFGQRAQICACSISPARPRACIQNRLEVGLRTPPARVGAHPLRGKRQPDTNGEADAILAVQQLDGSVHVLQIGLRDRKPQAGAHRGVFLL